MLKELKGIFNEEKTWERDYPEVEIDREQTYKYADKHRGSIRFSTGRFYTKEELEKRKKELLEIKLP